MGTQVKSAVLALACCAIAVSNAVAQTQSSPAPAAALENALHRSICERIGAPMAFATRDTTFALSLPSDEPATVYMQLTVGKNGKVKEKLTKVHANHIAGYVAPTLIEATKGLHVDRNLLHGMNGKDTSLLLAFPLEYQCVYDTINKAWPDMTPKPKGTPVMGGPTFGVKGGEIALQRDIRINGNIDTPYNPWYRYSVTEPTRIWYYLAFIKGQQE